MSTATKSILIILLLILIGAIGYTYVLSHQIINGPVPAITEVSTTTAAVATTTPAQEIATSTPDGDYYAYVKDAKVGFTSATLTLEHVTYFTGATASSSAAHDVTCPDKIETCVPTLREGYYVRESGAPWFNVDVTLATKVVVSTTTKAVLEKNPTLEALGSYKPVILVSIKDGKVTTLKEITRN